MFLSEKNRSADESAYGQKKIMINKSLKITSVSGFNYLIKNILVFLIFDLFNQHNDWIYAFILVYIYFQSYFLHCKFTLKRKVNSSSFFLFLRLNLFLFLIDYFIFDMINQYFPYFVFSTLIISFIVHFVRILLFSKEME